MTVKKCKACGKEFETTGTSKYCKRDHYKKCECCGKEFKYDPRVDKKTCSRSCASKLAIKSLKPIKCELCGEEFIPSNTMSKYCSNIHYTKCEICGKEIEIKRGFEYQPPRCCSKECTTILRKRTCLDKYGVEVVSKNDEVKDKLRKSYIESSPQRIKTCLEKYGCDNPSKNNIVREKISNTVRSKEYQIKFKYIMNERYGCDYPAQNPEINYKMQSNRESINLKKYGTKVASKSLEVKEKISNTVNSNEFRDKVKRINIDKYGVDHPVKLKEVRNKIKNTMIDRYGISHALQDKNFRQKANRNKKNKSSLEIRLHNFLNEYNIKFKEEYVIQGNRFTHSFDIYLPDYKILIDCDGIFYHGYLTDPDAKWVQPYNDVKRLDLITDDHIFLVIVESEFERGIRELEKILELKDSNIFDYDTEIFKWCREVGFPYPKYNNDRLIGDYNRLCNYSLNDYKRNCWYGLSTIRHFHKSIWKCNVNGKPSIYDAWNSDKLLKKVISNRLIYKDEVDPSKVLGGFNISKIAPRVSIFNPTLARYITLKYLNTYNEIFDPFSGFSGRLLGVSSCDKIYIGQDIRIESVNESNEIIKYHKLDNCKVVEKDIFDSEGTYESLLTCPPYHNKEIYTDNQIIKNCDDWIDECLGRFKCKRYIFVVDRTEKYKDKIIEKLECKSYFRNSCEYIICIDG